MSRITMNDSRRELLKSVAFAAAGVTASQVADAQPQDLLPGFTTRRIPTPGATIHVRTAGSDRRSLLHGFPQTNASSATRLRQTWPSVSPWSPPIFAVMVSADKPADGENRSQVLKRAMVLDQVEVMRTLGFDRPSVVGTTAVGGLRGDSRPSSRAA